MLDWERLLNKLLAYHGKNDNNIQMEKKSAHWKVMIAHYMKRNSLVSNTWLASHLNMGRPKGVSQYVSNFERLKGFNTALYKKMSQKI